VDGAGAGLPAVRVGPAGCLPGLRAPPPAADHPGRGPALFAGQGVTTSWLLAARPEGTPLLPVLLGAACLAVVLGATALGAVPLHRRLGTAWDAATYRRLLRVDTVRALAATAGSAAALAALLG